MEQLLQKIQQIPPSVYPVILTIKGLLDGTKSPKEFYLCVQELMENADAIEFIANILLKKAKSLRESKVCLQSCFRC